MDKFFCTTFVLFFVFLCIRCDENKNKTEIGGEKSTHHFSAYYHHVKTTGREKKSQWLRSHAESTETEQRCPGYKEKVEKADRDFEQCVNQTFQEYNRETICDMAEMILQNCTRQLVNEMEGCLPEQSKQLVILIFKSLYSVTDYLCTVTGETLLELANPCLWKDLDEEQRATLNHCNQQIDAIGKKYRDKSKVTTKNICSDLESFKGCVRERVDLTCENPKTRRAFIGLYDAAVSPCNKIVHHV